MVIALDEVQGENSLSKPQEENSNIDYLSTYHKTFVNVKTNIPLANCSDFFQAPFLPQKTSKINLVLT